jgi:hypothetical protein
MTRESRQKRRPPGCRASLRVAARRSRNGGSPLRLYGYPAGRELTGRVNSSGREGCLRTARVLRTRRTATRARTVRSEFGNP